MTDADVPPAPPLRRVSPFHRWRRWAPRAAFECALIVFSVVLALALTGWAEDRRTARRVDEMRGYLIAEIRANRAMLTDSYMLPHHQALSRTFAAAGGLPGGRPTPDSAARATDQLFRTGLHQPAPRDAVWNSVASSDLLGEMDMEDVLALARVYRTQESLEGVNRAGYQSAIGLLEVSSQGSDAHVPMMRMTLYLEDLIGMETNLIRLYDEALAELNAGPPPAASRTDDAAAPAR